MIVIEKAAEAIVSLSCRGKITHVMKQRDEITQDTENEHDLRE